MHFSVHAVKRCRQRGLTSADLDLVLEHGSLYYGRDAWFVYLRRKDLPPALRKSHARLVGTTVVLAPDSWQVITVYRNPRRLPVAA